MEAPRTRSAIHPDTGEPREFFDTAQAATYTGCSEFTIRRYARDGTLPAYRVGRDRRFRFRRHDLDALLVPVADAR